VLALIFNLSVDFLLLFCTFALLCVCISSTIYNNNNNNLTLIQRTKSIKPLNRSSPKTPFCTKFLGAEKSGRGNGSTWLLAGRIVTGQGHDFTHTLSEGRS